MELRCGEGADERQTLAEGAARVEVRCQGDGGAGVDECSRRRHRPAEEERARRQEHAHDVARREGPDPLLARSLEMVDGPGPELDGERDRS